MKVVAANAFSPSLRRGVQVVQEQAQEEPERQVAKDRRERDMVDVELP
jgi:hypothetical protein